MTVSCEPFRSWCRLEPRPRAEDFDQVLRTEVHDALWFLTRQWQFGEFKGEDTGSAVLAKVQMETTKITKFQNQDNPSEAYTDDIPLETRVERVPVQFNLKQRAQIGQHWMKLLKQFGDEYNATGVGVAYDHSTAKSIFVGLYPFEIPEIDMDGDDDNTIIAKSRLLANRKAHRFLSTMQGRTPDGVRWYGELMETGAAVIPASVTDHDSYETDHATMFLEAATAFQEWYDELYSQPSSDTDNSWNASKMEYNFGCSLPNKGTDENTILRAEEYYQGRVDWYAFNSDLTEDTDFGLSDIDEEEKDATIKTETLTIIPSEARFGGMPHPRWWEFEDGYLDLGNISADSTDIAKILLAEFALVYSNDWFIIPYTVEAGSLAEVKGIVVTDTFGQRTLVEPVGMGDTNNWHSWTMYNFSKMEESAELEGKIDPRIFIPPALSRVQESKPMEQVRMIRDEMANMAWGVENTLPDLVGGTSSGSDVAIAFSSYLKGLTADEDDSGDDEDTVDSEVKIKYQLGNTVPEHWIPFLPQHLPDENRAIQLQRASMPRLFNGDFMPTRPRSTFLRDGMLDDPATSLMPFVNPSDEMQDSPYYVHEEDVPRSGTRLEATYQRARWYGGKTFNWYGYRKKTGKGEGYSGLKFDTIIDKEYEDREALTSG